MTNGPSNGGRRIRRIAIAAVTGVLLAVANVGVAGADEFTNENSAPTITSPTVSATIQPDADASDNEYAYSATVGDADTLNDLSTATLCLYHTAEGDSTCATTDPTNTVKITWTQSSDSFTIDSGGSSYWALGSSPAPSSPTLSNTSGTFEYTFVVSEVTREGEWTAALTVEDSSAATASDSTQTSTVNAYSEITTRTQQSFGTIATGGSAESSDSPTVTSNGTTTFSLTSGDFTDGTYTFTLKTDGTVADGPAAGEMTYDCHIGETFAEGSAVRVGSTSTQVDASTTEGGTVEDGVAVSNVCRVQHGGERPVSTYAFTVVNTIGNA